MTIHRITALVLLIALSGCSTSVTVEGTIPTPLISKLPAKVGVYYSEEFKSYKHEEVIKERGTWRIDLGAQNLGFFRRLMATMFEETTEVAEPPLGEDKMSALDGVLVPEIVKYGFLTPEISGLNFYSASIHYRIALYDKLGEKVGDWSIVGYGKSEVGVFNRDGALEEATLLAIRDGGARIAIDIPRDPKVLAWLNGDQ
jgi:hypothetical protein